VSVIVNPEAELTGLFHSDYARLVRSLGLAFDPNDAADAVQEAYLAAFRKWKQVARYDDPVGWIRRVAINRLLNEKRNRNRRAAILAAVPATGASDLTDDLLDLRTTLATLPVQMRLAVSLFYLEDLTGQQIADALGVSPSTVRSNLADSRARLRLDLQEEIV
jgi:RNA polymerase sigma-70 factor, ECF subfamily